jgi:ketosteroid isomerase-like protein
MNRVVAFSMMAVVATVSMLYAENSTDTVDVTQAISAFYAAIEKGDVEARIELLADNVILMPDHWTMMRGKDMVSETFRRGAAAVFKLKDREIVHMDVSGDVAYTVNSYYYTYHGKEEPEQWHKTKNVHIWRMDASGAWKLAVDIWNSDVPLEQFSKE